MATLRYGDPRDDYESYSYICYAGEDAPAVAAATDALHDAGFSLWMQQKDDSYTRDVALIDDVIDFSAMVIVFLSKNSVPDDDLMLAEYAYAASVLRKTCLPVWLDDTAELPSAVAMLTASHERVTPDTLTEFMAAHFDEASSLHSAADAKRREVAQRPCPAFEGDEPFAFVSYSHDDAAKVFPAIKDLYERGWQLWYDEGIRLSDRYITAIANRVRDCKLVLLMLTANAMDSTFVTEYELAYADSLGKPVIPVPINIQDSSETLYDASALDAVLASTGITNAGKRVAVPPATRDNVEYDIPFPSQPIEDFDFTVENGEIVLNKYTGNATDVVVPAGHEGMPVTTIDNYAFQDHTEIRTIIIPDSVTTIRALVFNGCSSLTTIYIPESVVRIGRYICDNSLIIQCAEGSAAALFVENYGPQLYGATLTAELVGQASEPIDAANMRSRTQQDIQKEDAETRKKIPFDWDKPFALFYCDQELAEIMRSLVSEFIADGFNIMWRSNMFDDEIENCSCFIINYPIFDEDGVSMNALRKMLRRDPSRILQIFWAGSQCPDEVRPLLADRQGLSVDNLTSDEFKGALKKTLTAYGCHLGHARNAVNPDFTVIRRQTGVEIAKYTGKDTHVVIPASLFTPPQPVIGIGDGAFEDVTTVQSIEIPSTVKYIGQRAFAKCTALTHIVFPPGIKTLSYAVLWDCESLEAFDIPDGVLTIEKGAFEECQSLKRIVIPDSVTEIGRQAFSCCDELLQVHVPKSVTSIGRNAFAVCPKLTIVGSFMSYARRYAKENDLKFATR